MLMSSFVCECGGAGKTKSPLIDQVHAVKLLGTMQGGYNVGTLIEALDTEALAPTAAEVLSLSSHPRAWSRDAPEF